MHIITPEAERSMVPMLRIGAAGWSLPADRASHFPAEGSHLERYALRFGAVEINSSFHRPHRRQTYERWAASTPADFSFAAKLPKTITHEARLVDAGELLDRFLAQVGGLGEKLGYLVVQLPPSLAFDLAVASRFLRLLRSRHAGSVALEPRHASWFEPAADALLVEHRVARILADPVLHGAVAPGGWTGQVYLRLHGTPRRYWSSYPDHLLRSLATRLRLATDEGVACCCIFDNTASGAAVANALELVRLVNA